MSRPIGMMLKDNMPTQAKKAQEGVASQFGHVVEKKPMPLLLKQGIIFVVAFVATQIVIRLFM